MSEPDFGALAENSPVLLLALDAQGALIWSNREWRSYTGVECFPTSALTAIHEAQRNAVQKALAQMLETPKKLSREVQLQRHDGEYRWFQLLLTPCITDANLCGISGALFDLTDVKMAEEQMLFLNDSLEEMVEEQTRHLKQANDELKSTQSQMLQNEKMASIGQLAAGVAHEINNPMGFIGSNLNSLGKYLQKLEEYLSDQDRLLQSDVSESQREDLMARRKKLKIDFVLEDSSDLIAESLEGASRVQKIVLDLKSFSRVDHAEVEQADLNDCLESTISIIWNELKYSVTLEKDFADLDSLRCLPQQLNQVFMNILINGSHAIGKQGTIRIKTWQDEENQYVAISDDGCGISKEHQQKIFEPFFTTKEVGKGSGLGMSISFDIIKKHGGEIRLESELGVGSTFTLVFPRPGIAELEAEG
ncbi:MAG: ATP-binding protein [Geopsychrobacter sp.]|nr:ATP-binding protein [Geopsychrobacter sp.]